MKFEEALAEWRKGKKIKLSSWSWDEEWNKSMFEKDRDAVVYMRCSELLSDDWLVVEEPGKSFLEVFEAFKEGKKIRRKSWFKSLYMEKNSEHTCAGNDELLSNDWEVIE